MKDQRATALAQILVQLLDEGAEGRRLRDPVDHAPPSRWCRPSTRRCCAPAATRSLQHHARGRLRGVLRAGQRRAARLGARPSPPGRSRRPTSASCSWRTPTRARSRRSDPKKQARAQKARKPLMDASMKPQRRGRAPLGADALPDPRLRHRGGHVAVRRTRTSTTRRAWSTTPTRSPRGSASPTRCSGSPSGSRASEEVHITAPGHRHQAGRGGPHAGSPASAIAQHARRRVLHRPASRTRSRARSPSRSRPSTAAARSSGVQLALRGRQGRRRLGRARRGLPDRDARHRRRRPPPRRARHRHQLRHRHRHQGDPARREDRRHACTWRSA